MHDFFFFFFPENKQVTLQTNREQKGSHCPDIKTLNAFAMWLQGKFFTCLVAEQGQDSSLVRQDCARQYFSLTCDSTCEYI